MSAPRPENREPEGRTGHSGQGIMKPKTPAVKVPKGYQIFKPQPGDKKRESDLWLHSCWHPVRVKSPWVNDAIYARKLKRKASK